MQELLRLHGWWASVENRKKQFLKVDALKA